MDAGINMDEPEPMEDPHMVQHIGAFMSAALDEMRGEELPQDLVDAARQEEFLFLVRLGVFKYDTI